MAWWGVLPFSFLLSSLPCGAHHHNRSNTRPQANYLPFSTSSSQIFLFLFFAEENTSFPEKLSLRMCFFKNK
jgi:hypothetical protein